MRENWPDPALPTAANAHHHRHQHRDIDFFTRNYFSVLRWPSPGKGNDDDDSCNCTRRFGVRRNETKTKWMKYISVKSGVNEEDWHSVWERECVYKKERKRERKRERESGPGERESEILKNKWASVVGAVCRCDNCNDRIFCRYGSEVLLAFRLLTGHRKSFFISENFPITDFGSDYFLHLNLKWQQKRSQLVSPLTHLAHSLTNFLSQKIE